MKLVIFLLLFLSYINRYDFFSQYLERIDITANKTLEFRSNNDGKIKYNIIEIFNLFEAFNYINESGAFAVNEVIDIFQNYGTKSIILSPIGCCATLWVRVIGITNIFPGGCLNNPRVTVKKDTWSITLSLSTSSVLNTYENIWQCGQRLKYAIYGLPIYPLGNITSWSTDYKDIYRRKEGIVTTLINNSIVPEFLGLNGNLLYSNYAGPGPINYTLANRINRDFLLIIVAYGPDGEKVQYPPVYVDGCLANKVADSNCRLFQHSYPMYIMLACAILFIFFAIKHDLIHVLFCGWITTGVVTMVVWKICSHVTNLSDTALYIIWFGVGPGIGFSSALLLYIITKRTNRIRMFFTAITLTLTILSIIWFTPLKLYALNNKTLFWAVSGTVALLLMILLSVFNDLTRIIGGIFLSAVLISLSCSINNLNASIIPFIFIDFYNSILYSSYNWIYYSLFLKDDLIIVILCPTLSFIIGSIFYISFKRSDKKNVLPEQPGSPRNDNYGSIPLHQTVQPQVVCNIVVNTPIEQRSPLSDRPPSYNLGPTTSNTSNDYLNTQPPSYQTCMKTGIIPSAPIPSADE